MSVEKERTLYANSILVSQQPLDAAEIVRVRLSQAKLLNDELSSFFKKYHFLRSTYAQEIDKLFNSFHDLNTKIEHSIIENQVLSREEMQYYNRDALGGLAPVWDKLGQELQAETESNNRIKRVLEKEILPQLAGYTTKNARWTEMRELHKSLTDIATHMSYHAEKANKSEKHRSQLDNYNQQWDSEAPFVFEVFETTDIQRLNFIKDSLLRFVTACGDSVTGFTKANEGSMEAVLDFDPEKEVERFAKVSSEATQAPAHLRKAAAPTSHASSEDKHSIFHTAGKTRAASTSTTGTTKIHNNGAPSIADNKKSKEKEKNKLRSRVGSIFGRKKKSKEFNGNGLSQIEDSRSEESSLYESTRTATRPRQESRAGSYISNHTSQLRGSNNGTASSRTEPTSVSPPSSQPQSQQQPPSLQPLSLSQAPLQPTNKTSQSNSEIEKTATSRDTRSFSYGSEASDINQQSKIVPQIQPEQTNQQLPLPPLPYGSQQSTIPTPAFTTEQHKAPTPPPSRKPTQFNNLGNISEDQAQHFNQSAANESVNYSTLPTGAPTSRKDIQSGLFHNLNQASLESYQNKRLSSVASLNPQATGSSIIAANSTLLQHSKAMTSPGLNASIAEVVNAKFKDGELVSSSITGEIALNYVNDEIPTGTNLKIEGISSTDRLIPNPQFIRQVDAEEFELTTSVISGKTLGGLKYSIKNNKDVVPVVILPAWRFEEHQSSIMLTVKLSNEVLERLPADASVSLNDLVVSVALNGVSTSALSKPQGTFNKEKSRITWKFPTPVTFSHSSNELKLIARFVTESEGSESEQGVVLKFSVDSDAGAQFIGSPLNLLTKDFDDEDPFKVEEWKPVNVVKALVSGAYSGNT